MTRYRNTRNNSYVSKNRHGKFYKQVAIKRSLAADKARKSYNVPKRGHGDQGDYSRNWFSMDMFSTPKQRKKGKINFGNWVQ